MSLVRPYTWQLTAALAPTKMFRESKRLTLIVTPEIDAIEHVGHVSQAFVAQATHDLAMFQQERYFMAANLKHAARAAATAPGASRSRPR